MCAFSNKVPAVVVGLITGVVEHEDLVQGLKRQETLVFISSDAICICPVLGDESIQNASSDHLALNLVAVLDQGHGKGASFLQGVSGQLIEDFVILGLLPLKVHSVVRIDGLQVSNEQGQCSLATAGVAHTIEHLTIGLFDSLLSQFFQGHAFRFFDDFLGSGQFFFNLRFFGLGLIIILSFDLGLIILGRFGSLCTTGNHTKSHAQNEKQCDQFFHVVSSSEICFADYCRRRSPTPLFYWSIY